MSVDLNLQIGDKVVYPNHGVGVIEQIGSRTIGSNVERYYMLKIKASSLKVMIPFSNAGNTAACDASASGMPWRALCTKVARRSIRSRTSP